MAGTAMTIAQVLIGLLVAINAVVMITATFPISQPKRLSTIEKVELFTSLVVEETTATPIEEETATIVEEATSPSIEEVPTPPVEEAKTLPTEDGCDISTMKEEEPVTVEIQTKLGTVRGVEDVIKDSRVIYSFRGIPFAEPPVGELRFKDPVAVKPWTGVKGGQKPPMCAQNNFPALKMQEVAIMGQEDCLYLNVYTPKDAPRDLPVMVFIYGGSFIAGDADMFGGKPKLLLAKDIILVSVQYRLGALGFLSTEDSIIPGNYGMKDQVQALRWVQENIREFGGDPGRVTIFGQGAGGMSVHLLVLSPHSEGLFQQAIIQSGTALERFAIRDDHKEAAGKILKRLECSADGESLDSAGVLTCLQKASVEDIVLSVQELKQWDGRPEHMVPRVDGDFLPKHPAELMIDGQFPKVNLMAGICKDESADGAFRLVHNETIVKEFPEKFDLWAPLLCEIDNEESSANIARSIFHHYLNKIDFCESDLEDFAQLLTDCAININHDESLLFHAKEASAFSTKLYAYEFEYRGKDSILKASNLSLPVHLVPHMSELPFLFNEIRGLPGSEDPDDIFVSEDPDDIFVSELMVQLWTDFAITGNPTPDLSLGFKWHPMTEEAYHYLAIRSSPVMRSDKRAERREFWKRLPLKLNKMLYPELFA